MNIGIAVYSNKDR